MATLFKAVNYSLDKLVQDIEMGEIGLPEIQRPFVWRNTKVRDLFDSMYRGFPVGNFLLWANAVEGNHRHIGTNQKQQVPRLLIVDGQQRLTSLYAVLKGIPVVRENYQHEYISIAFRPLDQKFEVADAAIRRDPEFIPNISALWSSDTDLFELTDNYLEKLRATRSVAPEELKSIRQAIGNLQNLQSYSFTALELSPSVDEQQVAEVFVRINSQGTQLNQADFILRTPPPLPQGLPQTLRHQRKTRYQPDRQLRPRGVVRQYQHRRFPTLRLPSTLCCPPLT